MSQTTLQVNEIRHTLRIDDENNIKVVSVGIQGPPGVGEIAPINFAYGDATPALLTTINAGKRVYTVELILVTAFDGTGAALSVGPLAAPTELMITTENNPGVVASYETNPDLRYASQTAIYLHITPGSGASAGAGQVRLQIEP